MILVVDSGVAYLLMPYVKSCFTSYFQIVDNAKKILSLPNNRAILVECKILHCIVSSATEVEIARVFYNV